RHRPEIAGALTNLFMIAMQISEDRLKLAHDLAFKRNVHSENAVSRRMLRSHRHFEQLTLEPRAHADGRSLHCFECFNGCAHVGFDPSTMPSAPSVCGRDGEYPFAFSSTSSWESVRIRNRPVPDNPCASDNPRTRPTSRSGASRG